MPNVLACPTADELHHLATGEASPDAVAAFSLHLEQCPNCAIRLEKLPAFLDLVPAIRRGARAAREHSVQGLNDLRQRMHEQSTAIGFQATSQEHFGRAHAELTRFLAPPQGPDELGRLGKYRILRILGHGGMGVVFEAEDPALKRTVAIKAMLPTVAASASAGKRFLREAQVMAAVEHDHIVRIYQVDEDRGVPFLAMEFLKGEPLDARLQRDEAVPIPEILRIGREIAAGLAAAHTAGLIHRDIKPGNIWLEAPRSRVKILDFGLARASTQDSGLTQQGAIMGTPAYMAPEQANGQAVDGRADLFSLGVVLYRLCTGRQPFQGASSVSTLLAIAAHEPPPPTALNAGVPQSLSDLVMKLLAKNPAQRIGSAAEVVRALQAIEKQSTPVQSPTESVSPLPLGEGQGVRATPRNRRPLVLLSLLCLAGLVIAGVFGIIRIATPEGDYVIDTDDPDISFSVSKGTVILEDKKTKRKYNLKVVQNKGKGEWDLEVADPDTDLVFNARTFTIKHGEQVRLKAWFERKQVAGIEPKKINDPPPGKDLASKPATPGQSPLDALDADAIPKEERFAWQPKELVAVLGSHRQRLPFNPYGVAISPDGKRAVAGGVVWDIDSGQEIGSVPNTFYPAFTHDGKKLFITSATLALDWWLEARTKDPMAEPKEARTLSRLRRVVGIIPATDSFLPMAYFS